MNKLISALALVSVFAATTAFATVPSDGWHAEAMTADGSSIYNDGETVWAWAGGAADTSTIGEITVNGVTFQTVKSLSNKPSGLSLPFSFNHALSYDGSGWGSESVTDEGYKQMLSTGWWRDNYGTSGITYTLSGLEVGEKYLIQTVYHRSNESCTITLDGLSDTIKISGTDWKYGGTFVGVITAAATSYSFTIYTDVANRQYLNAIQLRKLGGSDPVAPSVGSTTAKGGLKGKVTLANVVKGTNDDGSEKATSYSVYYQLNGGETVTALTGQTGTTATFSIAGLADGDYTVSTWITTDKDRSTAAQSANFTIDSTQPSWSATPMSATGDTILTDGTLVYAYGHYDSTSTRTVNGVTFDIRYDLTKLPNLKVKPNLGYSNSGFGDEGVAGDYGDMLKYAFWNNQSGDYTYTLSGLEKGAGYIVQIVVHRKDNDYTITAPDEETFIRLGKDGWTYGGALTCEFTATNTVHSFVLNYGGNAILNALQVRKVKDAPPPVTEPEIGSVTAKAKGAKATISLADVVMGTDDAGVEATKYTVNWTLSGQETRVGSVADQTASAVSFDINDLSDGDYTCSVTITTDKSKTSPAKSAVFTINSTIGDFDALKSAIEGAETGDTITVAKGYYYATSAIAVTKKITIVSSVGASQTIIDGGYPDNSFVLLDVKVEGVKVSGLTFKNSGNSAVSVDNKVYGFEITDCVFENCHAATGSGIIGSLYYSEHDAQSASVFPPRGAMGVINGCAFKNCAANGTTDCGGAVSGPFWIENSVFDGCSSEKFAPVVFTQQNMMITNCTFRNSPFPSGSGRAAIFLNRSDVTLKVLDCKFSSMTCHGLFGGSNGANILVDRCDIENCTGTETLDSDQNFPYALFYGGDGVVRNTLIHSNKNPFKLGNHSYQNCTIVGNVGGFFVPYDSNQNLITASFTNCVFANNTKWPQSAYWRGDAGLQWHGGNETICSAIAFANCILQGASSGTSGLNGLLAQDPSGASATLTAKADEGGVKFKDPANGNWAPMGNSSPLVNGGVYCAWMNGALDLAGQTRFFNGAPDVGCYEHHAKGMVIMVK